MGLAPTIMKTLDRFIIGALIPSRQDKMQLQCDPGGEILHYYKQYFVIVTSLPLSGSFMDDPNRLL